MSLMGQQDGNRWILSSLNDASLDDTPNNELNGNTTTLIVHATRNQKCQQPNVALLFFVQHCHISGDAGGDVADNNFTN